MPPKAVRVRVEAEAAYITFRSTDAFALPEALAETEIRIAMPSAAFPVDASGIVSRLRQAPGIDRRRVESHPILALISTVSAAATATAMPGTMTGIVGATAALLGLSAPAAGAVAFGVMAFLGLMSVQSDLGNAQSLEEWVWIFLKGVALGALVGTLFSKIREALKIAGVTAVLLVDATADMLARFIGDVLKAGSLGTAGSEK